MNGLLGASGLAEGGFPDVLACLLPRERGCSVDSREFVVSEADRDRVLAGVVFAGTSADVGEHAPRLAYTPIAESRVGIGIRQTLRAPQVFVYAKPMTATIEYLRGVTWLASRIVGVIALVGTVAYR